MTKPDSKGAFELSFDIHFATNIPRVARLLPRCRRKCIFKNCEDFLGFCGVVLSISNNSMQWMNKIRI